MTTERVTNRTLTTAKRVAILVTVWFVHSVASFGNEKPNFIIINVDDLGYGDIGPFGATTVSTPNLDRMASEGRTLRSHYAAPVCSPSRASLLTGCYPKRSLPTPHVLFPASAVGLHPDEVTIAEILQPLGYATGCIGKWHLGDQPGMLPTDQGFDYYFGLPYSNDMGPIADGIKSNPGQPLPEARPREDSVAEDGIRRDQPPLPLIENQRVVARVDVKIHADITRRYTEKAVEFVRQHKKDPFFLYLPHSAVHFPLYPHPDYRGKSAKGLIGDWIQEVDWCVGEVLNEVRELGLAEKTMVIFTSDNGGALRHGSENTPLRGGKGSTMEGGMRVCTVAWWPGKIPAGSSTMAITSMMDLLPTIAGRAGAGVPDDRVIDGVDVWPAFIGDATPRNELYYFRGARLQAVRRGPWKLHLQRGQLYNLDQDIGESRNVSADHVELVSQLRQLAAETADDLGVSDFGPGCRPLGRVVDPKPIISMQGEFRPLNQPLELEGARVEIYKQASASNLYAYIFEPDGHRSDDRRPTAVFFFGGAWRGGSSRQFHAHCQYLASRGMVAIAADYRVSTRHGTSPFECVEDGKSAIRWVRANAGRLGVDSNRIAAGGGSAGGHVAAATGNVPGLDGDDPSPPVSSKPNALLLFNPVYDNGPNGYGHDRIGDRYEEISPLHNLRSGAPPTVVFFGTNDSLVPVSTAREYEARMNSIGSRCETHLYEGQPHGFFNTGREGGKYYRLTVKAMDEFLGSLGWLEGPPTIASGD